MNTGIIKMYNIRKGIGFITDDKSKLLVFIQDAHIVDADKKLKEGDVVKYDIKETDMGPAARLVKRIVAI